MGSEGTIRWCRCQPERRRHKLLASHIGAAFLQIHPTAEDLAVTLKRTVKQTKAIETANSTAGIGGLLTKHADHLVWSALGLFVLLFPLAFVNYEIYVDEGWLGQQVYSLISHGMVTSQFFRDLPPLDGTIVIYHKLLIWAGAALSYVAGWGLYTLRTVSLLAGLGLIGLMYVGRLSGVSRRTARGSIVVLLFTPLFVKQMIIFRPEMLVVLFGFASFLLLRQAVSRHSHIFVILAGFCAGLSGTAHAAGLSFAAAGVVVLLVERKYLDSLLFALCSALAFFPYVSGLFFHQELFLSQVLHNKLISGDFSLTWYQPLLNLLNEHQRWFRKPEVIGLSVLFVLALLQHGREAFRQNRLFWIYFAVLAAVLAMAPLPKITRYMLPLAPFMAMIIADCWFQTQRSLSVWIRTVRYSFAIWSVIFLVVGLTLLVQEAMFHKNDQIATNHRMAVQMQSGALVMAPFDFVFNEQPQFMVQSYRGAKGAAAENRPAHFLERYADSLGVRYLVISPEEILDWKLDLTDPSRSFHLYAPVSGYPDDHRWLVRRLADSASVRPSVTPPR